MFCKASEHQNETTNERCTFIQSLLLPTAPEFKRLSPFQRAFAGNRYSDHIATLSAFAAWEDARVGGEQAEISFCDYKGLSMPTLRVIWEAKVSIMKFTHEGRKDRLIEFRDQSFVFHPWHWSPVSLEKKKNDINSNGTSSLYFNLEMKDCFISLES